MTKQRHEQKDCVMYDERYSGCIALKVKNCDNCSFHTTHEEYERKNGMSYERAMYLAQGYIKTGEV